MAMSVILCISDTQIPFEHRDALSFCQHLIKPFQERGDEIKVVHLGDEVDQYSLSRWPKNPNAMGGGDELKEAKHRLSYWFDAFPSVKVCKSNHTYRAAKVAAEAGLPAEFLKSIGEVYGAPETWEWRDRWIVDDILFEHGEHVSGALAARTAAIQNRRSTVIGHQHQGGGVNHIASFEDMIFGMNVGCLIDVDAYAFEYGRALRNKPTLGCGIVIHGIPHFVPMILSKTTKRWVGRSYVEESPS